MNLLPNTSTFEAYRRVYREESVWLPAMRVICDRHGLDHTSLRFGPAGTHVVFFAGANRVIKLFAPPWVDDFIPECLVLDALSGRPEFLAPRPLVQGELEGWPYMIMTAVKGISLEKVWADLSFSDQKRIVAQLGDIMAGLHALPTEGLGALDMDWPAFIQARIAGCIEHHASSGASESWLEMIGVFLKGLPRLYEPGFRKVLLSADITIEHLFVDQAVDGWHISGLIDFGDAMLGNPLYEFVAPGFITRNSPELQRTLLLSYGFQPKDLTTTLADQLMAYVLLHKYGNLPDYLALFGAAPPRDMAGLQAALWLITEI